MKPSKNPIGMNLTVDEVQLHRASPHPAPTSGAFAVAWEWVKQKPAETILLGLLMAIFSGGCNFPTNFPTDLGDFGDDSSGYEYDYDDESVYQYDDAPTPSNFLNPNVLPKLGGDVEDVGMMAMFAGLGIFFILLIIFFSIIFFFIGLWVRAWGTVYWLRLIRGQDEGMGAASKNLKPFIVSMALAAIISALGIIGGLLLLIIPAIILAIGWSMVSVVIVDKNLGPMDAIKASLRLTNGHKLSLFVFFFLAGLLNFGGMLLCGVGFFVTNAIVTGALIVVYDRIAEPGNAYLAGSSQMVNVFE